MAPPKATVDADVFVKYFPRYLCLSLHENRIITIEYSDLIREEYERNLRDKINLSEARIAEIREDIKSSIGNGVVLDTIPHKREIAALRLKDKKDRHVLYLASITKSRYLVTYNLGDFTEKQISHDDNKHLGFHPNFEVSHFDRFLCTLIEKEKQTKGDCEDFLAAVAETMVPMRNSSVRKTLRNLAAKDGCPGAYELLRPYTKKIEKLVARKRHALR